MSARIARSIYSTGVSDMGAGRLRAAMHNLKRALAMCPEAAFVADARERIAAVKVHLEEGGAPDEPLGGNARGVATGSAGESGAGVCGGGDGTLACETTEAAEAEMDPLPHTELVMGAVVKIAGGRGLAQIVEVDGPLIYYEYEGASDTDAEYKRKHHRSLLSDGTTGWFLRPPPECADEKAERERAAHHAAMLQGKYAGKISAAEMSGFEY